MTGLFDPLTLRGVTVRNRVWLSPMCQYSVTRHDGVPHDWHLVHLGARAAGGFGLVLTEASAVLPEGRISPADTGMWNEEQAQAWERIGAFVRGQGATFGMQLAHAGRKAATYPWLPGQPNGTMTPQEGGWEPLGPSAVAMPGLATPREMTEADIAGVVAAFAAAAGRCDAVGMDVIEIHAAHGYLLHQFLSPVANHRTDGYGGSFAGRTRLLREVVEAVRGVWPERKPVLLRVSATDWLDGQDSWDLEQTVQLAREVRELGVDLIDVSSGGVALAPIPRERGYQVSFAAAVRERGGIPTGAVGLVVDPDEAAAIIADGAADAVFIGRAALRDAAWPHRAAHELGVGDEELPWPPPYHRGSWAAVPPR